MHNSTDFGGGFGLNFKFNATLDMQNIKESMLKHVRIYAAASGNVLLKLLFQQMCASTSSTNPDEIMDQVIGLVKKFDKIDAHKVTETADFQKDLSLDSLDLVELVMAFEKEFSIEIPQEKADNKLTCCADVAKYIQASKAGESTNDDKY